jgi:PelA/Pel-15E family pectate lyase
MRATSRVLSVFALVCFFFMHGGAQVPSRAGAGTYDLDRCVNTFTPAAIESTRAGYQYWFAGKEFVDGRTLKLSVVRPHDSTHAPHAHVEDEFFFVLEGRAEFYLDGRTRVVGPYTSLYCPPNVKHGIRNVGDGELKYLVIKKYPLPGKGAAGTADTVGVSEFQDSAHHWYDIRDEARDIEPLPGQPKYDTRDISRIADNILLFQKKNGGWPKNYDMLAILTDAQKKTLAEKKNERTTTFDNGATHSQVKYLAAAHRITRNVRHRDACLRGIDFILKAQLANGGWQQFFPDTSGYRRYITFNDGAMIGVMKVLQGIVDGQPEYAFVDSVRRAKARAAFKKGVECILRCQMKDAEGLTAWCQQHDNHDFRPRAARTFEPVAVTGMESAEIVLFLMSLPQPTAAVVRAVQGAVQWFDRSRIHGVRVKDVRAPRARYMYHETESDRILVSDSGAPPLWARYYEIGSNVPLFCNRDGKPVYSLAEVDRERRTGYAWYSSAPAEVLKKYPAWQGSHAPGADVIGMQMSAGPSAPPMDTSFTTWSAWQKLRVQYPRAVPAVVPPSPDVRVMANVVYTAHGYRHLSLDLFTPEDQGDGPFPGILIIHGGGWRSGNRKQEIPMARELAAHGYVAAVVEYRLSAEAQYPAGVHDLKAAVRWMRAHAHEYMIDSSRIGVMGGSAGGTLAALLGATGGLPQFEGKGTHPGYSSVVQAVVDIDGIVDFTDSAESGKDVDPAKPSAGKLWFGGAYRDRPDLWKEASPLTWVSARTPPILFVNSSLDRFHAGRDTMIAQLNRLKVYSEVHSLPDTPHPFWLFRPWFGETSAKVIAFFDRVLKNKH